MMGDFSGGGDYQGWTITSRSVSGTFSSDGSYFGFGSLSGETDARDMGPLFVELGGTTDPEEICGLMQGFGVQCGTCSSDGQPYCINVLIEGITATETGDTLGLVCEPDCHENCSQSSCDSPQSEWLEECE